MVSFSRVLVLFVLVSAGSGTARGDEASLPLCSVRDLKLDAVDGGAPATGRTDVHLIVTNTSASLCYLSGFVRVQQTDRQGAVVPFVFYHDDHFGPPQPIKLEPHKSASLTLDKFRCDEGSKRESIGLRLYLDRAQTPLRLTWSRVKDFQYMGTIESYCGPDDAGSEIGVTDLSSDEQVIEEN